MNVYIRIHPIDRRLILLKFHAIIIHIRAFFRLARNGEIIIIYSLNDEPRCRLSSRLVFTLTIFLHAHHAFRIIFLERFNSARKITEIEVSIFKIAQSCTALVRSKATSRYDFKDFFYHALKARSWDGWVILTTVEFERRCILLFRWTTDE